MQSHKRGMTLLTEHSKIHMGAQKILIAKAILNKRVTKLEASRYLMLNILQSYNNQISMVLAQ